MPLMTIALVIVLVGVLLWAANRFIPMAEPIPTILNVVVGISLVLWVLAKGFGVHVPIISPLIG